MKIKIVTINGKIDCGDIQNNIFYYNNQKFDIIDKVNNYFVIRFSNNFYKNKLLKIYPAYKDYYYFLDDNNNYVSLWFTYFNNSHPHLYYVLNNKTLIYNLRCGFTTICTTSGYIDGLITLDQYNKSNFIYWEHKYWNNIFNKSRLYYNWERWGTFKNNKLYMSINSNIKSDILKRMNLYFRRMHWCEKNLPKEDKIGIIYSLIKYSNYDKSNISYCDPHLMCKYSQLKNIYKVNPNDIQFYDISKMDQLVKDFYGIHCVKRHIFDYNQIGKIVWDDLTEIQQNNLLNVFKDDQKIIDNAIKNGNIII